MTVKEIIEKMKIIIKYSQDEIIKKDLIKHILPDLEKAMQEQEEMKKALLRIVIFYIKDDKEKTDYILSEFPEKKEQYKPMMNFLKKRIEVVEKIIGKPWEEIIKK